MKKRLIFALIAFLPLHAAAQGGISKRQSFQRLEAIQRLQKDYIISLQRSTDQFIVRQKEGEAFGVVDTGGRVVIPFQYDWIEEDCGAGLYVLFNDTAMGFADRNGRIVAPLVYGPIEDIYGDIFYKGLCSVSRDGKYGIIDRTGRFVVPLVYDDYIYLCDSGYMTINHYDYENNIFSSILMRFNGDTILGPFSHISYIGDGLLRVDNNKHLCGIYDLEGNEVVKCKYDYVGYGFNNGLMVVKKYGRNGVVDRSGREVIPPAENRIPDILIEPITSNLFIVEKEGKVGAVDSMGQMIVPLEYDGLVDATSDRFVLGKNDYDLYVFDATGRFITHYEQAYLIFAEYEPQTVRALKRNGLWGLCDSAWRELTPFIYKSAEQSYPGHCKVTIDDVTTAIIDDRGKMLFKGPYSTIMQIYDGVWQVVTYRGDEQIGGLVDDFGQTTLTRGQLKTMKRWMKLNATEPLEVMPLEDVAIEKAETESVEAVETPEDYMDVDEVFVVVEHQPEFPGGDSALYMFICMNLSYPDLARDSHINGTVIVSFIVQKDGTVGNVKVVRDIGGGCGQAAVEMVKSMPRWKPGMQAGKPVNTQFILPIKFEIYDDDPIDGTIEQKCLYRLNNSSWKK